MEKNIYVQNIEKDIKNFIELEKKTGKRIDWDYYFIKLATSLALRSTCLRRRYGAIIVDPNTHIIISTGYNGNPAGVKNCTEIGYCFREKENIPKGMLYDLCLSVHAEQNAIMRAGSRCKGKTMYISGFDYKKKTIIPAGQPCITKCTPMIINSGLEEIVYLNNNYKISRKFVWEMREEINKDVHKSIKEQLELLRKRGLKI